MQHLVINPNDFTDRRVHRLLAAKLPSAGAVTRAQLDRYSIESDEGIQSQVERHNRLRAGDPDVDAYAAIPPEAFDPKNAELVQAHQVVFLTLLDIHPCASTNEHVGAMVVIGQTLFLRLTTSSTKREIHRPDGEDDNAYTVLVLAVINHLAGALRELRWTDDTRRAGREGANWQRITRLACELGLTLTFGIKSYDPQNEKLLLDLLGGVNEKDDVDRRKSLSGGRLTKLLANAAPMSEGQMPAGVRHARQADGRLKKDKEAGKLAERDPLWQAHLPEILLRHSRGDSYVSIGLYLAEQKLPRSGQTLGPDANWADFLDNDGVADRARLSDAAQGLLVGRRPDGPVGPDEVDMRDSKLSLWDIGHYPYQLNNDLKQRGVAVGGVVPTYRSDNDVTGYFSVTLKWDGAVDFGPGVTADERTALFEACRARIAREQATARTAPGRLARAGDCRLLGSFGIWTAEDPQDKRYPEPEITEWAVASRARPLSTASTATLRKGRPDSWILLHRPASTTVDANGRKKGLWTWASKPTKYVAATFLADNLCTKLGLAIERLVLDGLIDPAQSAPLSTVQFSEPAKSGRDQQLAALRARIASAEALALQCQEEAAGLRTAAGLCAAKGEADKFSAYDADADVKTANAKAARDLATRLTEDLQALEEQPSLEPAPPAELNLSQLAYLQASLLRAGRQHGRASTQEAQLAQRMLSNWRFVHRGERVLFTLTLSVPLRCGSTVAFTLNGSVNNIRERTGRSLAKAHLIVEDLLDHGRTLDDLALHHRVGRASVLTSRVMPWLVQHGVTSRGAKNALIDHPLLLPKRLIHAHFTAPEGEWLLRQPPAYRELIVDTYTDPDLHWGDAACPDDTIWIAQVVATLNQAGIRKHGIDVLELALMHGRSERDIRELVRPQKRDAGFTRPIYLRYADPTRTRVTLIGCPHGGRCKSRNFADHVVLLPEVARSGYGVLCSTCRRAPNPGEHWQRIQFTREYLGHWTNRGFGGSLRTEPQTLTAPQPIPLEATPYFANGNP